VLLLSIFPVGLFAAGSLYLHWQSEEENRKQTQIESVRLLATTVDNAVDSSLQRLQILARLWGTMGVDNLAIYTQARAALAASPDWSSIIAFGADGSGVFSTDLPFDDNSMHTVRLPEAFRVALHEQRAVVSNLFTSPRFGDNRVGIAVPVMRASRISHVLIVHLNVAWFDGLLAKQSALPGAVAGIFDGNWRFLARSVEGQARRGTDPARPLVADMMLRSEGVGSYASLNGIPVYTAWTTGRHGWWVASATPSQPMATSFFGYLGLFALLWLLVMLAGTAYAVAKGRLIAGSLASLERQAKSLARGAQLSDLKRSSVEEIDRTLAALEQASGRLAHVMQERDRSLETERAARAAAEQASRAKDEFLAMLGHELRNPLSAIANASAVLKIPGRDGSHVDFAAEVIARQTAHLKRLIDDLLDVGRALAGKIRLQRVPLELEKLARQTVATLRMAGRLADRQVEIDADAAWIEGDLARMEQIITNLLVNSARFTAPGGRITLSVKQEGERAVLRVSDDGRGIAPESLSRIFELFFQADVSVDRAGSGLGVGLTLVERLVQLHGGTVTAASEGHGRGATFEITLPAIAAPIQPLISSPPARPVARTILVVEDNADVRNSLRLALGLKGHRVLQAADGSAALKQARIERPAVALLDIGLPGMDGYQLAAALRAELGEDLTLVAITGYGTPGDLMRARQSGFDAHITKPVDLDELMAAIDRAGVEARVD
jgi:signal transduction histidine kinase/ActR/RegA family two-component response regulator